MVPGPHFAWPGRRLGLRREHRPLDRRRPGRAKRAPFLRGAQDKRCAVLTPPATADIWIPARAASPLGRDDDGACGGRTRAGDRPPPLFLKTPPPSPRHPPPLTPPPHRGGATKT